MYTRKEMLSAFTSGYLNGYGQRDLGLPSLVLPTPDSEIDYREAEEYMKELEYLKKIPNENPDIGKAEETPLSKQVGGDHYKNCGIQPVEFIAANDLDFFEGNVVKYITRHKKKGGASDVKKVIHYSELLLKLEYGET